MDLEDPKIVLKTLLYLYQFQTLEEKVSAQTVLLNHVGFTGVDAPICSSIAQRILNGHGISQKQFDAIAKILPKYHAQFDEEAIGSIELPVTAVIYDKEKPPKDDGLLFVRDGKLLFEPHMYPTGQIKELGFKWSGNGTKAWVGILSNFNIRKVKEMFPYLIEDKSVQSYQEFNDIAENPIYARMREKGAFPFQQQVVGFTLENKAKRVFAAMGPGTGKSLMAIFACKAMGGKTLIISPVSLMRNWKAQIKLWVGEESYVWHQRLGKTDRPWIITNYESMVSLWTDHREWWDTNPKTGKKKRVLDNWECIIEHDFDNIIIDESILVKNRKAQRSLATFTVAQTIPRAMLLTGNPTSRFLDDLFMQAKILYPKRFTSYWNFAKEYCHVVKTQWAYQVTANQEGAVAKIHRDWADFYIARSQEQVLDLPPWIFDNLDVEMRKEQLRMYEEMEATFRAELPSGDVIVSTNILSQLTRLIQFASNPVLIGGDDDSSKWDAVLELVEFEKPPYIIWTSFILTAELIKKRMEKAKLTVSLLTGQVKEIDRQPIVDKFQRGQLDALVVHPGVGKFGHTLTAANTAIYLERGYSGDNYYQSLYRVKRIGTTSSPHVLLMRSCRSGDNPAPTVDHVIHQVLEYRKENSAAITTGEIRRYFESMTYD